MKSPTISMITTWLKTSNHDGACTGNGITYGRKNAPTAAPSIAIGPEICHAAPLHCSIKLIFALHSASAIARVFVGLYSTGLNQYRHDVQEDTDLLGSSARTLLRTNSRGRAVNQKPMLTEIKGIRTHASQGVVDQSTSCINDTSARSSTIYCEPRVSAVPLGGLLADLFVLA